METFIGRGKKTRRVYGLDEVALVPSAVTVDPEATDTSCTIGNVKLKFPIIASAMDGVVDAKLAIRMGQLGGLAVLNLQGVQTRYEDPSIVLEEIASVDKDSFVGLMQRLYQAPIKPELIAKRVKEIKAGGVAAAVSSTPQDALQFGKIAAEAGADIFFVQATVVSTKHVSKAGVQSLDLAKLVKELPIPVVVGNCVTYDVAMELMETGVAGIMVGIGPGAACTSRGVLGVGIPQATAIADCAAARDDFYKKTGRYVAIIGDGGMAVGGDICKAIACGGDAVMIGSPIARASEAPGRGFHWGMATPSPVLPRGTRIRVGTLGTLEEILLGPAKFDDGSVNLVGALRTSMGTLGARTIKEMQQVEVVIAPSLLTEGKVYQKAQHLGMGK